MILGKKTAFSLLGLLGLAISACAETTELTLYWSVDYTIDWGSGGNTNRWITYVTLTRKVDGVQKYQYPWSKGEVISLKSKKCFDNDNFCVTVDDSDNKCSMRLWAMNSEFSDDNVRKTTYSENRPIGTHTEWECEKTWVYSSKNPSNPNPDVPSIPWIPTNCKGGRPGANDGSGGSGACCKTSDDCKDTCNSGVCGGGGDSGGGGGSGGGGSGGGSGSKCTGGRPGANDGSGITGACCKTSDDCKDTCSSGVCGGGSGGGGSGGGDTGGKTRNCQGGRPGANDGSGGNGACCFTSDDCLDTCTGGACGAAL